MNSIKYSKTISVLAASLLLEVSVINQAVAKSFNPSPIFKSAASYSQTIATNNDPADIYYPNPPDLSSNNYSFPVVLLLPGVNVDKSYYSNFANLVARYGFIVVVPNHFKTVGTTFKGLLSDTSQLDAVLTQMKIENSRPTSPIVGAIDTKKLGLLGHSGGGAVGLSAIANSCLPFLCSSGSFTRPQELVAGAFFGANLRNQADVFIPINNSKIPTVLLQGDRDSRALPFRAKGTYENIQTPPKALITVLGVNHFGITDINNPVGAIPDDNMPSLSQEVGIETIARWSGLFLRASILDDREAFNYIYSTGDANDPNVSVISISSVPKASSWVSLLTISGLIVVIGCKRFYFNHRGTKDTEKEIH